MWCNCGHEKSLHAVVNGVRGLCGVAGCACQHFNERYGR